MPTIGIASCEDQDQINSQATKIFGVAVDGRHRAVVSSTADRPEINWTMTARDGGCVDLRDCLLVADGGSSVAEPGDATLPHLAFRVREMLSGGCITSFPAHASDPAKGKVKIDFDGSKLPGPGIYVGELAMLRGDGTPIFANYFDVYVEDSLFNSTGNSGPPRMFEIRMQLRDSSKVESRLLGDVTFDDAEISLAVARAVQYYNEINPPIMRRYDTSNFPSRYFWCMGAAAYLFGMVAEYYRKNQLAAASGGVTVDDMNKEQNYTMAQQAAWKEFTDWARGHKIARNIEEGFGHVSSDYGVASYGWRY